MSEATKKARTSAADLPRGCEVLLSREQVCAALGGISTRTFDRMLSTREFPAPDTHVGVLPRWRVPSVNRWIESRCQPTE